MEKRSELDEGEFLFLRLMQTLPFNSNLNGDVGTREWYSSSQLDHQSDGSHLVGESHYECGRRHKSLRHRRGQRAESYGRWRPGPP